MDLRDIIAPEAIFPAMRVGNKKQALQELSEKAAALTGLQTREIFDTLLQRERLGSTGIGSGIAIPHGKLPRCPAIVGVFARLHKPIEFEALDDAPVDLIFLLVAPEGAGADHLNALSRAARALRDPAVLATIRSTRDASVIYSVLVGISAPNAA
jgi:PTS system nitrogen regulatory IIA component